jgi:GT2 family glycosyltransferase
VEASEIVEAATSSTPSSDRPTPAVAAIVVTHDPGDWLEEVLEGLAAQDYDELSVLVVDAGSSEDLQHRIGASHPHAFVRRLEENPGYSAAANIGASMVDGAAMFLFCHDDVVLEPDTLRTLVDETYRSNCAVVGPKQVRWDAPRELLTVGMGADKLGYPVERVERGEFDQGQHDSTRDVFYLAGGCTLIRSDLFGVIGGFDEAMDVHGDDLDICWRAHVAGARVMVAPTATVRHLEGLAHRRPLDDRRRLQLRHRLRCVLSNYSFGQRLRVVPQALILTVLEVLYALVAGRDGQARDVFGAWKWNVRRYGEIRRRRAAVKAFRTVNDREIRRLQAPGLARLNAFMRGQIGRGGDTRFTSMADSGRGLVDRLREGPSRATVSAWSIVGVLLVLGGRHLLTRGVPAVGQFSDFTSGPGDLLSQWFSGFRDSGLGSDSPAPTAFGLLSLLGAGFLGAMGLLRQVLILGCLPLGVAGIWRAARPLGSAAGRGVAVVAYAAIPVGTNAMAVGSWSALSVYALAPWILGQLARGAGVAPYGADAEGDRIKGEILSRSLLAGVLTALMALMLPLAVGLVAAMGAALAVGLLLTGQVTAAARSVLVGLTAAGIAVVLHIPWVLALLGGGTEWSLLGATRDGPGPLSALEILSFDTGPVGVAWLGFGLMALAALPLLIGRGWRAAWAVRFWMVALGGFVVVWLGEIGLAPVPLPPPEVLLAPAAAALSLAAGLAAVAYEEDIRGRSFGFRQPLLVIGAAGGVALILLFAIGAGSGRWEMPRRDLDVALSFVDDPGDEGAFRVLWVGDAEVLPVAGWRLTDDAQYAVTSHGLPEVQDQWAGSSGGATAALGESLRASARRETSRLGRLLAPMGVRYVVVVERLGPKAFAPRRVPAPEGVSDTLASQLDLEEVGVDPALLVYENTAWAPVRSALPESVVPADGDEDVDDPVAEALSQAAVADLSGARPVLPDQNGFTDFSGPVESGDVIYSGTGPFGAWNLEVDGTAIDPQPAFGFGSAFVVDEGGDAELSHDRDLLRAVLLLVQIALWVAVLFRLARRRVRSGGIT